MFSLVVDSHFIKGDNFSMDYGDFLWKQEGLDQG